jgi:hypothetical protein
MSRLNAMMDQYKTNSTPSTKKKTSNVFNEDNYFGTFLPKGINSAQKQIRIVEPEGAEESPFLEIFGHKKKVDGKWRTFICPKHEKGEKCPFCEAREILLAEGSAESRKESNQFSAKKMYVAKVIDREFPDHGVKFWRFNHHYKNAGTFDKINAANGTLPKGEDPVSSESGRDMIISVTRDGDISVVTGINYNMSQTPLSSDSQQMADWRTSSNEKTWEDVYSVKPYEYLEIIVRGGIPMWEKDASGEGGKFVDKVEADAKPNTPEEAHDTELSVGVANANETAAVATESVAPESAAPESTTPPAKVEEEDDDLPF